MAFKFEFDPRKSASNKTKHGIDFTEAQDLWDDKKRLDFPATSVIEPRAAILAKFNERY